MIFTNKKTFLLFLGDFTLFYLSLGLMLIISYLPWPNKDIFTDHLVAFSGLIVIWLLVFFIAGLYERQIIFSRRVLVARLFKTQIVNTIIAVFFFYLIPFFSITPKLNLFLYLVISFGLIVLWRLYSTPFIDSRELRKATLIAYGDEMEDLKRAINTNQRYGVHFILDYDTRTLTEDNIKGIVKKIQDSNISLVVVDLHNKNIEPLLPHLYSSFFTGVRVIDVHDFYESVFDRIPLSLLNSRWFIQNIPYSSRSLYDFFKRSMDVVVSYILGIVTLPLYPLVYLAIKLDDRGSIFFFQERVGKNNKMIRIIKFRSMSEGSSASQKDGETEVTRAGSFLRKTRIDEIPQLWNVFTGDLSLIGPRPETGELAQEYEAEIPYYTIRHIIKPGLSGWAQLFHENHPHHGSDVSETKVKLSYDLYYIKNRSLLLDVVIALKTIRTLLSRSGR